MKSSVDDSLKAKMSEGHWPPQDAESLNLQRWYVLSITYAYEKYQ